MPDATRASVRGLATRDIQQTGVEALVVNTYHLYLQPGVSLIEKLPPVGTTPAGVHTLCTRTDRFSQIREGIRFIRLFISIRSWGGLLITTKV